MASVSDTARLLASLELQDKFSGTAAAGEKALGGLESKSSFVSKGFGLLSQAGGAVGGAFNHLKGRIGQLISGPLGMIGLGAGLFSIGKLLTDGIGQAQDFGKEVGRLAALTGLSTEATSRLAGAFHHFGIETDTALTIAGMAEKNLFKLGGTTKAADKFLEKYGFSLVDSAGRLKDFNTLLLDTSDFFNNKQIPAATKAAALAAIYGRNWQALIPILGAGRKAISDAEDEAAALGLTLTKDNLDSLKKLKAATRDWGTALGGLKLQLGLAVVPLLTDLTTGATNFLKATDQFGRTGSQRIVGFFKDLIGFGKQAFGVIETQVVPVVKKVIDGWNNLPAPLKGLLVKGVSGNFAIKFLLGFDPIAIAGAAATAVAGKLAGTVAGAFGGFIGDFFGRTAAQKLIPQAVSLLPGVVPIPVLVTNPGFGLPGTGGGGPGGGLPTTKGFDLGDFIKRALGLAILTATTTVLIDAALTKAANEGVSAGGKGGFTPGILNLSRPLPVDVKNPEDIADVLVDTHPDLKLPGAPGGGGPPKPIPLDDKALIAALAKTSEFGKAGVGTTIEHGITTGTDPFGEQALALFERAEFPKQGKTLGEIERHIIAAEEVQKTYLQEGDINSAKRTQAVIDGLHALLGSTDKTIPPLLKAQVGIEATQSEMQNLRQQNAAAAAADQAKQDSIRSYLAQLPGPIRGLAAKDFAPKVAVTVNSTTNVSVSNISRTLSTFNYAGKISNLESIL